ncbi:MAG: hypothetical protein HZA28_06445 [Candidatus Omnitrophica bacterium]|nr:hypothetical protein [Candidatus Omnitrophota bacterium]
MKKNILIFIIFSCVSCGVFLREACASSVVIKVRAINPLDEPSPVKIHYPLPEGVTPKDITAKRITRGKEPAQEADFKVRLDKGTGTYFIDDKMTLEPKEIVVLAVEVRDVWTVAEDKVGQLYKEAEDLLRAQAQQGREPTAVAMNLKDEIFRQLRRVLTSQQESTIALVGVQAHIDAYKKNAETLRQAETDITMLQNMLAAAQEAPEETGLPPAQEVSPASPPAGETPPAGGQVVPPPVSGEALQAQPAPVPAPAAPAGEKKEGKTSVADKLKSLFKWK